LSRWCRNSETGVPQRLQRSGRVVTDVVDPLDGNGQALGKFEKGNAQQLLARDLDRAELASQGLKYERLDQLTMDILLGVR
jgi:hypothetical protein